MIYWNTEKRIDIEEWESVVVESMCVSTYIKVNIRFAVPLI